jgi:hypothetical protein
MQVQHYQEVSNLSNAPQPDLCSSWWGLPQQLQLSVGAAGLHLLQSVRKSKSKSQSRRRHLANAKQKKRTRTVHFRLDQEYCVLAETSPNDSPAKLTDADCQTLWWSPEELLDIRQAALSAWYYRMESEQEYSAAILVGICAQSDAADYFSRLADEKQTKKQRRVSFCLDQENHVLAETFPNDSPETITDVECQALWWSPKELLAIQQSVIATSHYLIKSEQDYCRALAILVGICARSDTAESSLPDPNPVLTCAQHGVARGLTVLIVPTLPIRSRRSVRLVLQAQADMRNQTHRDRMLAAKYHYCSRYATAWARVLAEQDAACCYE